MDPSPMQPNRTAWIFPALLILAAFLCFGAGFKLGFINFDDNYHLTENPRMSPVTAANIASYWKKPNELPLTYTVWSLAILADNLVTGHKDGLPSVPPSLFHGLNIVLHTCNGLLVYVILLLLLSNSVAAFCGALIFLVHPVQIEPVIWITGLRDCLSGFFSLLSLLWFVRYCGKGKAGNIAASFLAYAAAVLSKPTAMSLPLVLFVVGFFFCKKTAASLLKPLSLYLLAAIPFSILTIHGQPASMMEFKVPFLKRFLVAADSLAFYARHLIVPVPLSLDYGRYPEFALRLRSIYPAFFAVIAVIAACGAVKKLRPVLAVLLILVAGLLPVLGIVPFVFQDVSTVADRYLYFPIVGLSLGAGLFVASFSKKKAAVAGTFLVILGYLLMNVLQIRIWNSEQSLYQAAVKANPRSFVFLTKLGVLAEDAGDFKASIGYLEQALALKPNYSRMHFNLAVSYQKSGRRDEALQEYEVARTIQPAWGDVYVNMAAIYIAEKKYPKALDLMREGMTMDPSNWKLPFNTGQVWEALRDYGRAKEYYQRTLELNPSFPQAEAKLAALRKIP